MALDLTELGGFGDATISASALSNNYSDEFADIAFSLCMAGCYSTAEEDYVAITDGGAYEWKEEEADLSAIYEGTYETNVVISSDLNFQGTNGYSTVDDMHNELVAGAELLIHNVALKDTSCTDDAVISKLGLFQIVKLVETPKSDFGRGSTARGVYAYWDWTSVKLYFDRTVEIDLDHFHVQAVLVHRYRNFTVGYNTTYNGFSFNGSYTCGGVRVIKCNGTFTMESNSNISLTDRGLPPNWYRSRPLLPHERSGTGAADVDPCAGSENSITHNRLLLNIGDGGGGGGFQGGGAGAIVSIGSNVNHYYGGGGAGACVIYCNQYENADFDAIVLS